MEHEPDATGTVRCVECGATVPRDDAFGAGDDLRCPECAQGVARRLHARMRPTLKIRRPIATMAVLAVSVVLFVLGHMVYGRNPAKLPAWFLALYQDQGIWGGAWWKHATSMFLHGGILHIAMNGLALWQLGQIIEAVWGRATFLAVLLAAGTAGSAASWVVNAPVTTVGLSGGIFGLATFLFALRRHHAVAAVIATTQFRNSLIAWFAVCLVLTWTGTLLISNSGHAIGALTGWLMGRAHVAWKGKLDALAAAGIVVAAVLVAARLTIGSHEVGPGVKIPRSLIRDAYLAEQRTEEVTPK
ncbi:MAG: rhomboid family intramembrane serine protease [Planctomycetota bacterium]